MSERPSPGQYPRSDEYSRFSENLRSTRRARNALDSLHKAAIRRNSAPEIETLAEVQYLYLGIEAEALLRKILFDPTGFSLEERLQLLNERSQINRWLAVVSAAFSKHYLGTLINQLDIKQLEPDLRNRYQSIRDMLDLQLRPIIEDRNKLAHAQAIWQLKSGSESDFKSMQSKISFGDHWNLTYLQKSLSLIGEIVLILVVSKPTFERDFASLIHKFAAAKQNVEDNSNGAMYEKYKQSLPPIRPRRPQSDDPTN